MLLCSAMIGWSSSAAIGVCSYFKVITLEKEESTNTAWKKAALIQREGTELFPNPYTILSMRPTYRKMNQKKILSVLRKVNV